MRIIDTTPSFFQQVERTNELTVDHLEAYYAKFSDVFDTYFASHCQRSPERLAEAIERYPTELNSMRSLAAKLPTVVEEIYGLMYTVLNYSMELNICLLVGGYGSNAYVTHDGTLHFAVETLPCQSDHLRVLVAHEMAHAFHFQLLKDEGFQFSRLAWDGYTSLYLEGVATVLSKRVVPDLPPGVYFSFDDRSAPWIAFCEAHSPDIYTRLNEDLAHWTMDEEVEWFRIRGGKLYGLNRLGYFVASQLIEDRMRSTGVRETMTLWAHRDLKSVIQGWMSKLTTK